MTEEHLYDPVAAKALSEQIAAQLAPYLREYEGQKDIKRDRDDDAIDALPIIGMSAAGKLELKTITINEHRDTKIAVYAQHQWDWCKRSLSTDEIVEGCGCSHLSEVVSHMQSELGLFANGPISYGFNGKFIILRRRNYPGNRGGYPCTVLLQPGAKFWAAADNNAGLIIRNIIADPCAVTELFGSNPGTLRFCCRVISRLEQGCMHFSAPLMSAAEANEFFDYMPTMAERPTPDEFANAIRALPFEERKNYSFMVPSDFGMLGVNSQNIWDFRDKVRAELLQKKGPRPVRLVEAPVVPVAPVEAPVVAHPDVAAHVAIPQPVQQTLLASALVGEQPVDGTLLKILLAVVHDPNLPKILQQAERIDPVGMRKLDAAIQASKSPQP